MMKGWTIASFCRPLAVLALVACNCAATSPLVRVNPVPLVRPNQEGQNPGREGYDAAYKLAHKLMSAYQKRVSNASALMMVHHIAEALSGGGAVAALTTQNGWKAVSGVVAIASSIFQVVAHEGDLERQREAYSRGISVLECATAITTQTNNPRNARRASLTDKDERARADTLFAAIDAVESSVAAAATNTTLGEIRSTDSGGNSNGGDTLFDFWKEGTDRCLSRLVPDIRPVRLRLRRGR